MKRLVLVVGAAMAMVGCSTGPKEIPPRDIKFVIDDCALIAAIARDHYKLARSDAPLRAKMAGEDLPWRPGCDFQGMGFNLVEVTGPEGVAATQGMGEVGFHRPRYDDAGAEMRSSITRAPEPPVHVLCRLTRNDNIWSVASCGPDPRTTQPRPPAPSPADVTPEGRTPPPADRPPTARDLTDPQPNPGPSPEAR
jgi:hypothetical protein